MSLHYRIICILFFALFLMPVSVSADNTWWDNAYRNRKILTFNNSGRNENLVNFPVLIKLSAANFDFTNIQSDGRDMRFVDSDNKTVLPYEIEQWDSAGKIATIWVKVPQIDANSPSDFIYLYFGNNSATDGQTKAAVWQNGYLGVWHMNQNPASSNTLDSTANGYHALPAGSFVDALVDGKVGKATTFTTANKLYYNATNAFKFPANQDFSVSIWSKEDLSNPKVYRPVIGSIWTGSPRIGFWFLTVLGSGTNYFALQNDSLSKYVGASNSAVNLIDGNWHHLVGVRKDDNLYYYVDGVLRDTQTGANFDLAGSSTLTWSWTSNNSPSVNYAGVLDETQISNTARSADWVSASYAAMTDAFVSYSDNKTSRSSIDITLNNDSQHSDGQIRMTGSVYASDAQFLPSAVQYQMNGGNWRNATIADGTYDEQNEEFYVVFSPADNDYKGEGYSMTLRAVRGSEVEVDNLIYFHPFELLSPSPQSNISEGHPPFSFHVNKDRYTDLEAKIARFQIEINKNDQGWYTYVDSIPAKAASTNLYETDDIKVLYSEPRGDITVEAKGDNKILGGGMYKWRIVAVDQRGHKQQTEVREFSIGESYTPHTTVFFPLTILSISGAANLHISTTYMEGVKSIYTTSAINPVLFGIASRSAKVQIEFVEENCTSSSDSSCRHIFSATSNDESRWRIYTNGLKANKQYKIKGTVALENNYNQLPSFKLITGKNRRILK